MPTQSDIDLINRAYALFGEEAISSLDEDTYSARLANELYEAERDALLTRYNWGFATERAILTADATKPLFGFAHRFLLPADCLRLRGLYDGYDGAAKQNYSSNTILHKVEGRYILADDATLYIYYIKRVTNPADFDPLFREALKWAFAMSTVQALTNSSAKQQVMEKGFNKAVKRAEFASAIEGTPEIFDASVWMDSRFDYGGPSGPRQGPVW